LRGTRHDNLIPVEVGPFFADDVRVEERRLFDLVELVLVRLQAVLPLLDLVAEGVEVALVLPTKAIHLLLELVPDFFRRLGHLPVALITRHFWITAGLRARFGQDATASALGTRVCGTSCRLVPSLVRKWHPELKLLLSVLKMRQPVNARPISSPDKGEVASAIRERLVVANEDGKPGRARARRRAVSLGVSALDQLLDIRGQDPSEAHVAVGSKSTGLVLDEESILVIEEEHVLDDRLALLRGRSRRGRLRSRL